MAIQVIPCSFVASFKVRDNLVYNSSILCRLVEANDDDLFNKPIIIQAASILEASLSEIIARAKFFYREGMPNISTGDQLEIRAKKSDKFYHVINILRKHEVLHGIRANVYDDLHKLRDYRNKIHIQDNMKIGDTSRDENCLFSEQLKRWSLELNLEVLNFLSAALARPPHIHIQVRPLTLPA